MTGVVHAGTGDTIADLDVGDVFGDCDHRTGTAVAEAQGLIETAAYGVKSVEHAFASRLVEHLPYEIGTSLRLLQHVLLGELDHHPFRACRNQRRGVLDEDVPGQLCGRRNL